jgi:hypothetical protein
MGCSYGEANDLYLFAGISSVNNEEAGHLMLRRAAFTFALLALIVTALGMIALAVARYPALFSQPGARTFVLEPICALVAYAVAIFCFARPHSTSWDTILPTAVIFGLLTGTVEIANMGIENGIPFSVHGPVLQISFMLTIFTLWGIGGGRTARALNSIRAGLLAAVSSAGICMLIAVTAGFVIQFFLVPPEPAYVATWAEFKRSGWTDARAFGLANTLDSGFTHLVVAPVVAVVFGGIASLLVRSLPSKPGPIVP